MCHLGKALQIAEFATLCVDPLGRVISQPSPIAREPTLLKFGRGVRSDKGSGDFRLVRVSRMATNAMARAARILVAYSRNLRSI